MTEDDPTGAEDATADGPTLVGIAEDEDAEPERVQAALTRLLRLDPRLGADTALGLLAREPRIKPSTGLLVDPGDTVMRRWRQRVAAGRALVAAPLLASIFDEVYDELTDCADFARDVLTGADITPLLSERQRAALENLSVPPEDADGR